MFACTAIVAMVMVIFSGQASFIVKSEILQITFLWPFGQTMPMVRTAAYARQNYSTWCGYFQVLKFRLKVMRQLSVKRILMLFTSLDNGQQKDN